jgi:SAM-dependent methyltransferase
MEVTDDALTAYDKVLYPARAYSQTHPNRLATVGFLRGMNPAPIDRCRVLELGCGAAANLAAMASQLPQSEFIGIDLARRPIAAGQAFVADSGLRNVRLQVMDLCRPEISQLGQFDFIIAHGVYSWVPQPVRERILDICREMLAPQGVAYVSYNAYPGNHFRDLARGFIRFHTKQFESITDKVGQARGLLKFLAESRSKPDYYTDSIRRQLERTLKYDDASFFHDDLGPINQPFYFHEFISDAERHGLQFVGEAYPGDLDPPPCTPEVAKRMSELEPANEVVREQYKDFLSGAGFRQTLLCRKEIELAPDLQVERIPELFVMCEAAPMERPGSDLRPVTFFKHPRGVEIESTNPLLNAALTFLCTQWPCAVSFSRILDEAKAMADGKSVPCPEGNETAVLAEALAKAYRSGFLLLNIFPPKVVNWISECPAVSELARCQLQRSDSAVSQLHASLKFPDSLARQLVLLLDGTRDQQMLAHDLIEFVKSGGAKISQGDVPVEDLEEISTIVRHRVQEGLQALRRSGMLVS